MQICIERIDENAILMNFHAYCTFSFFFFLIHHSAWYLQSVIRLSKYIAIIEEHCIYV